MCKHWLVMKGFAPLRHIAPLARRSTPSVHDSLEYRLPDGKHPLRGPIGF
jgi:hypothetical protein